MPNTDSETVANLCEITREIYRNRTGQASHELFEISISLGYATKKNNSESLNTVIKTAGRFMYRCKLSAHKHLY